MRNCQYLRNVCQISALVFSALTLSSCSAPHKMAPERQMSFAAAADMGYLDNPTPAEASRRNRQDVNAGERMVAYSASLGLIVKNVDDTKKMVLEQIKSSKGFIVRETGSRVTARIPSKNLDNFLINVKILGETRFESKEGEDITDQYRDNTAALNSLKVVRDRYMALLERADSVNDILSVEKEIERLNLAIERLEGKIKYAEQSVSYSIVTVDLDEPKKPLRLGPIGWVFYGLYHGIAWLFVW